jgi:PST family polysaccharide transporter
VTSTRPPQSSSSDAAAALESATPGPSAQLARGTVGGFLWTTLAWGSNRLAILGLTLVLARLLAPADFGLVTAALTVIAVFDAALDLGVGAAVVAAQDRGISIRTRTAFSLNLALSALVSAVGVGCSGLIARLFHAEGHTWLFAIVFCYPLFRGAGQVNDAVLRRDLAYRRRTVVGLCRAGVRIAVSVPLALTVGGALSIAAGIVVSEVAAMALLWLLVPIRPVLVCERRAAAELLRFGGKVAAIRILGSFRSTFDYIVVGSAIGVTALGYYGMAYKLPELLIENVLWIITAIALPTYARALTIGRHVVLTAMLQTTRLLTIYGLAVGTALAVLARESVPLVFSPQWQSAVVPMMLISLSLGVMAVAWASGDVFTALGQPGTLVLLDLPATALMAGAFLYAAQYGLVGVAAVHLVFNLLYCLARMTLVKRALAVPAVDLVRAVLPGVAVALCVAVTGFGVQSVLPAGQLTSLLAEVAVCGITALGASLLFARTAVVQVLALALSRSQRAPTPTTVEIT